MVIDTHAHIGRISLFHLSVRRLLWSMKRYGVDFSLVSNIECTEYIAAHKRLPFFLRRSQVHVLKRTVRKVKRHAGKLGILVWLRIGSEQPDEKLYRLIRKHRSLIYGIKLHPFRSETAPDDPQMEPVYALARYFQLPVVSHTGDIEQAKTARLYRAAQQHPDINFVAVHMDLDSGNKEAIDLIARLPNLYGDTTWVPLESTVYAVETCGSEKILFGTDNPIDGKNHLFVNRAGQRALSQAYFNEFRSMVSAEAYDNIMYKNAEKLFHIKLDGE